jgi:hypothetical protein
MVMFTNILETTAFYRLTVVRGDDELAAAYVSVSDEYGVPVGAWSTEDGLQLFEKFAHSLSRNTNDEIKLRAARLLIEEGE